MKIKITTDFGSEDLPKVGEILDGVYWCVWRGIDLPVHAGYFEIIP